MKMNINRNNYEDFFLLYADGELRADECLEVEKFIDENKDLRIELEMLQAAILPVEEIVFIDKSFLYRETIFDSTLQEKLLLKIDNELTPNELNAVNEIISNNAAAKKELEILQHTKLDTSEKIVFAEKHLLYKKEKDNVVAFGWVRWAAAAMLIGFGLFFGLKLVNNKIDISAAPIVNNDVKPSTNKAEGNNIVDSANNVNQNIVTTITNNESNIYTNQTKQKEAIKNNANSVLQKQNNIATITKKELVIINENKVQVPVNNKKEDAQVAKNENNFVPTQKVIVPQKDQELIATAKEIPTIKVPAQIEKMIPLENTYTDVAIASTNNEKSENKILYIDEDAVKQSKAGGFFRKIKRLVERTANIKTGNSLQIAGFEIASR